MARFCSCTYPTNYNDETVNEDSQSLFFRLGYIFFVSNTKFRMTEHFIE